MSNIKRNHTRGRSRDRSSRKNARAIGQLCRGGIRKAKPQVELNMVRDVESDKKDFCRYISSNNKARENTGLLLMGQDT